MNQPANPPGDQERDLFLGALEIRDPAERAAFLEKACRGDARLRASIERLLAGAGDSALDHMAEEARSSVLDKVSESPGTRIGRYKLLQKIGEGGMGVVYMAEQEEPVRRRVALKIIKLGMDSRSVMARFEAERQALAMMDHPNIAKFFDAGMTGEGAEERRQKEEGGRKKEKTDSLPPSDFLLPPSSHGRPYFVMELVQGVPITEFCDRNKLNAQARLKLFMQVCQAIQSAHQKGIIHRDIKPSNVLVTLHDGVPVPKVIDFGIAKATHQKLTEKTLFTQHATMIGTPAYMSPEQAEMSGLDIDTRADIYSLGVLLYELLAGSAPFPEKRLRSLAYGEMQRVILEEEPEKPSTRLSTLDQEEKTAVARNRGVELSALRQMLRGDLDWIVMKCLEKDRQRRYETATGLANDILRHLGNEPVVARPPSAAYRLRKMIRRNKLVFAAGGAVAAALITGLLMSLSLFIKERGTRRRAETAEATAESNARRALENAAENGRQLLRLHIDGGARHLREGNFPVALSWFAQAFRLDRANAPGEDAHQSRLASIFEQCPRPMRMWFHAAPVTAARLSPDGKRAVSVTAKESALWDVDSGRSLAAAESGSRGGQVEFVRDGTKVAIGDIERPFIWDLASTPPTVRPLAGGTQALRPQWHPNGEYVAAVTGKREAAVWDSSGQGRHTLTHEVPAEVLAAGFVMGELAYPPLKEDATEADVPPFYSMPVVMTVDSLGILRFWHPETGERISQRELEPKSAPWQLAFFDFNYLLTVHNGESARDISHARIWRLATCRPNGESLGHDGQINGGQFALNTAVTWSRDGTARFWSADTGGLRASPLAHGSEVTTVARSMDLRQTLLATGCADGTARVWVPGAAKPIGPAMLHGGKVTSLSFGPAMHSLLAGSADGSVRLWNIAAAPAREEFQKETSPSVLATYGIGWGRTTETSAGLLYHGLQPGEPRLFPVNWRGRLTLTLGDVVSEQKQLALVGQESAGNVDYEVFQPDGRTLGPAVSVPRDAGPMFGSLSSDGSRALVRVGDKVRVWDPRTGRTVGVEIDVGFRPNWPRFSFDGALVALGDTKKIVVWDIGAGRERFRVLSARGGSTPGANSPAWIDPLQFDPAGERLLTAGDVPEESFYAAQAWDLTTGQATLPPLRHEASINFACFSPDGRWVATCGDDRAVRQWDARTGQPRLEAILHPDRVTTVCFSHDGRRLYSACGDGFFRIWDAATGEPLAAPTGLPVPSRYRPYAFPMLGGQLVHHTSIYNISWRSARAARPVEDWELWAGLLSGQRVEADGARRSMTMAELRETWNQISTRFPGECSTSLANREAWNFWMSTFTNGSGHGHTRHYLDELIELRPDLFVHRWHRADYLKVLNDWKGVAADLRVAARLKPSENAVWVHLVMAELMVAELAKYQEASAEMARRLVPSDRRAYPGGWAVLAAFLPNTPEVLTKLLAYLEADGPPPADDTERREHDFHMARGALSLRLGRPTEAIEHLEKARAIQDGDRALIGFLALARQAAGHKDQARALRDELRQRLREDERLHFSGRLMDSYGQRYAAGLLLKEGDEGAK